MATNQDLENIPLVKYHELHSTIQDGDILMYSGEDDVSKIIRKATQSMWSHVGILFRIEPWGRVMLLESIESRGVHLIPLSRYIQNIEREEEEEEFFARLVIARHRHLKPEKLHALVNFGIDLITRPYDLDEIHRIFERLQTGEGKLERDRAYMCSELVYECYLKAGISLNHHPFGFVTPEDIWLDKNVEGIAEIDHL